MAIASVISYIKSTSNLEEFIAGETGILPGHLVTLTGAQCFRNAHTEEDVTSFVAIENTVAGKGYDDEYEIGEIVYCRRLRTGDVVNLRFGAAAPQSVSVGDPVDLAGPLYPGQVGAGTWQSHLGISLDDCICGPGQQLPLMTQIKHT